LIFFWHHSWSNDLFWFRGRTFFGLTLFLLLDLTRRVKLKRVHCRLCTNLLFNHAIKLAEGYGILTQHYRWKICQINVYFFGFRLLALLIRIRKIHRYVFTLLRFHHHLFFFSVLLLLFFLYSNYLLALLYELVASINSFLLWLRLLEEVSYHWVIFALIEIQLVEQWFICRVWICFLDSWWMTDISLLPLVGFIKKLRALVDLWTSLLFLNFSWLFILLFLFLSKNFTVFFSR